MTSTPHSIPGLIEDMQDVFGNEPCCAVSIVIPAYNEAPHIAEQIRAVHKVMAQTDWQFEILVVDDGSSDETGERAATAGAQVLHHRRNLGYGAALKRGIAAAQYDWVLITDADGTYPCEAIPELLAVSADNEMVVGARTGEVVNIPLSRRPAKWFLNRLASYLAGQKLPDINSGLRLMRKSLVNTYVHLLPSGFSFTTTITLAAACNDHPFQYVPIDYHTRLGDSKIRPWHAYEFTLLIVRTIVFFNPLKVFIPLGALLALGGLAKFAYDVVLGDLSESAILGMLGALIIWSVGLLADQNVRLSKQR